MPWTENIYYVHAIRLIQHYACETIHVQGTYCNLPDVAEHKCWCGLAAPALEGRDWSLFLEIHEQEFLVLAMGDIVQGRGDNC